MDRLSAKTLRRLSVRLLCVIGVGIALSGCVVEPLYGPHYYRPYHYYGY